LSCFVDTHCHYTTLSHKGWQHLSDWQLADKFERDTPILPLPGSWWSGQHKPEFESASWWQILTRRALCKPCAKRWLVKELGKPFHKMQLDRGGKCKACKGMGRKTNLKQEQPLISMIFTHTDPRYVGRLDDKPSGEIIVIMDRVKEAINFEYGVMVDHSTWLWLTSEQLGFPLKQEGGGKHEERAEN